MALQAKEISQKAEVMIIKPLERIQNACEVHEFSKKLFFSCSTKPDYFTKLGSLNI